MDVEPKNDCKPKTGRREDFLLAVSKENTGAVSQSRVSQTNKQTNWGSFKHGSIFMKGFGQSTETKI